MNYNIDVPALGAIIHADMFRIMLGDKIGAGWAREVYDMALSDGKYVIKIETKGQSFQNIQEWEFWQVAKKTKWAKWFAPCEQISPCGTILVQHKAVVFRDTDKMPTQLPRFFTDLKSENYGKIGNQIVCVDYGITLATEIALRRDTMRTIPRSSWNNPQKQLE